MIKAIDLFGRGDEEAAIKVLAERKPELRPLTQVEVPELFLVAILATQS